MIAYKYRTDISEEVSFAAPHNQASARGLHNKYDNQQHNYRSLRRKYRHILCQPVIKYGCLQIVQGDKCQCTTQSNIIDGVQTMTI